MRPPSLTPLDRLNVVGCLFMYAFIICRRTVGQALHYSVCSLCLNYMLSVKPYISMDAARSPNSVSQVTSSNKRDSDHNFWKQRTTFSFNFARKDSPWKASQLRHLLRAPNRFLCIVLVDDKKLKAYWHDHLLAPKAFSNYSFEFRKVNVEGKI